MLSGTDPISEIGQWLLGNLNSVIIALFTIIVSYVVYKILFRQIMQLRARKRLEEDLAWTITRVIKWATVLFVFLLILGQFGLTIGFLSGFVALIGGTILGFASINTLGNAIAGLIVMINKPLGVGDRISFRGQLADVVGVELIYTKMRTLDNVLISIPNQELLRSEITNFGRHRIVRRSVTVTPAYEYDSHDVEAALLKAVENVPDILRDPPPYVWITNFQNYAVEYTLYAFTENIKRLPEIDSDLHKSVHHTMKQHHIDIRTPLLLQNLDTRA
jgi:small-conductance mechanosensitive channel